MRLLPTVSSFVLAASTSALWAQSPFAGTWLGRFAFYDGTTATGVPYQIRPLEFTVEEDGTITNVLNGVTNTEGTITGTVTAGGAGAFSLVGTSLTSGTFNGPAFTAQVSLPPAVGHTTGITQQATAQKVYGLLPQWQESTSGSGLIPANPYTLTLTASPSQFCGLLWEGMTTGWSTLLSNDGVTWTKQTVLPGFMAGQRVYPSPIRWLNDRYLFATQVTSGGNTFIRVFYSTDGISWNTSDTAPLPRLVQAWGYFGGTYYGLLNKPTPAVSADAIISTDGINWTFATLGTGVDEDPSAFAASPSRALLSINQRHGYLTTTSAAGPWSSGTFPGTNQMGIFRLAYGNGKFAGVLGAANQSLDPGVYLSPDGLAWNRATPGPPITPDDVNYYSPLRMITGDDTAFYGVADYWHGRLLRSAVADNYWYRVARAPVGRSILWSQDLVKLGNTLVATALLDGTGKTSIVYVHPDPGQGINSVSLPFVKLEPLDISKPAGAFASISASASGGGLRLSYQWKKGTTALPGKTLPTLSWAAPTVADSGNYTLEITNAYGTTVTRTATVTFTPVTPPVISNYPGSINVIAGNGGSAYAIGITVSGTAGTFTYQWRRNGENIPGATFASYTLPGTTAANSGRYDCVITWSGGTLTHPPAEITFVPLSAPAANAAPAFRVVTPGSSVFLQAGVTGPGTLTYQWQKDGVPVNGATSATLTVNPAQTGVFRCLVTSSTGGSLLGPPTTVTVAAPPAHNLLGKPLTKILDKNTARPDLPANTLGTLTSVRFREDTVLCTGFDTATSKEFLYRWNAGSLSTIASPTIAGDGGLFITGVARPYTEPSGGSFFFVGYHSVATNVAQVLYRWNGGTLTVAAKQGQPAPGGGTYGPFTILAGRNDVLFFSSLVTLPDTTTENRAYLRAADGSVSVFLTPASVLPGGSHPLTFGPGNFDGSDLLLVTYDSNPVTANSYSMMLRRSGDGTLSRLFDINTPIPGTSVAMTNIGAADVEGGNLFAGSPATYEAVFNADGSPRTGRQVASNVTACDAESWLAFFGRSVLWRQDNLNLTVIDSTQTVEGTTPTTINAEAHGREAAFLVANNSTSLILLATDAPASGVPVITYQPASRTMDLGGTVTFTALASGDGLSWQWKKGANIIPGATLNTLTLAGITAADAADYTVMATNSLGSATSNVATLSLPADGNHAPQFVTQPADQVFTAGKTVVASAVVDPGASTVTYNWTKNGQPWSTGTTSASLFISNADASAAGSYQLTVTNAYGSAMSRTVTLTFFDPNPPATPFVITNPVLAGGNYTFTTPVLSSGKTYLLQSSRTLSGAWTTVQTLTGTGVAQPVTIPFNSAVPGCFYRIAEQ